MTIFLSTLAGTDFETHSPTTVTPVFFPFGMYYLKGNNFHSPSSIDTQKPELQNPLSTHRVQIGRFCLPSPRF